MILFKWLNSRPKKWTAVSVYPLGFQWRSFEIITVRSLACKSLSHSRKAIRASSRSARRTRRDVYARGARPLAEPSANVYLSVFKCQQRIHMTHETSIDGIWSSTISIRIPNCYEWSKIVWVISVAFIKRQTSRELSEPI